jgi:L-aminopeptidase/D-esterase-like protein
MRPGRGAVALVGAATAVVNLLLAGPASAGQKGTAGLHDDITDVPGVEVGNYTNHTAMTGTTVVYFPNGGTAGYDVRSGAPITRETDLTAPTDEVQKVNAIMLTGGGDYGLSAAPGAVQWLENHDQGFLVGTTPNQVVPILPTAAINDLGRGGHFSIHPNFSYGYNAIANAKTGPVPLGNVGAGAGAVAGGLKGGIGSASLEVQPGVYVAALVVVNSVGTPVDVTEGCRLLSGEYTLSADTTRDLHPHFNYRPPPHGCGHYHAPPLPSTGAPGNRGGVIGVVATNVTIDKAMALKLAQVAQDGVTRAVMPAHTMFDGDVMFGVSTDTFTPAAGPLPQCIQAELGGEFGSLGCAVLWLQMMDGAEDAVSRAIYRAMLAASPARGFPRTYCSEFRGACSGAAASTLSSPTTRSAALKTAAARQRQGTGWPARLTIGLWALFAALTVLITRRRWARPVGAVHRLLRRSTAAVTRAASRSVARWPS